MKTSRDARFRCWLAWGAAVAIVAQAGCTEQHSDYGVYRSLIVERFDYPASDEWFSVGFSEMESTGARWGAGLYRFGDSYPVAAIGGQLDPDVWLRWDSLWSSDAWNSVSADNPCNPELPTDLVPGILNYHIANYDMDSNHIAMYHGLGTFCASRATARAPETIALLEFLEEVIAPLEVAVREQFLRIQNEGSLAE